MWVLILFLLVFMAIAILSTVRMRQYRAKLDESDAIRHDLVTRYEPLMIQESLRKPGAPVDVKAAPDVSHDDFVKLVEFLKSAGYEIAFTHEPGEMSQSTPNSTRLNPETPAPTPAPDNPPPPDKPAAPASQKKTPATKNHKQGAVKK